VVLDQSCICAALMEHLLLSLNMKIKVIQLLN